MAKFAELIYKIDEESGGSDETMHDLTNELDDIFVYMSKKYPDLYEKAIKKVERIAYRIDEPRAEDIVNSMKPYGEHWDYDTVKQFVMTKGVEDDFCDYYLVMNMYYNDSYDTAKMVGMQDDAEFYFSLARDFIEDKDAKPYKVAKYFSMA